MRHGLTRRGQVHLDGQRPTVYSRARGAVVDVRQRCVRAPAAAPGAGYHVREAVTRL